MKNFFKKKHVFIFLKGMAMGAADVVPGVSGGTIAFISGIYEELLDSISNLNLKAVSVLKKTGFKNFWTHINGSFLLSLFAGIAVSVISLAKGISWLLETQPILLWSFFFGLVLASVVYIAKELHKPNWLHFLWLLLGIGVAVYISSLGVSESVLSTWYLFLSGALAICAMILPGISGAFILVLLGSYENILNAVHERHLSTIMVVGSGAIIGLIVFSRFLKWTFNRYKNQTLAVLMGFIIGSLSKIWPWKEVLLSKFINNKEIVIEAKNIWPWNFTGENQLVGAALVGILGYAVIFVLEKTATDKISKKEIT